MLNLRTLFHKNVRLTWLEISGLVASLFFFTGRYIEQNVLYENCLNTGGWLTSRNNIIIYQDKQSFDKQKF